MLVLRSVVCRLGGEPGGGHTTSTRRLAKLDMWKIAIIPSGGRWAHCRSGPTGGAGTVGADRNHHPNNTYSNTSRRPGTTANAGGGGVGDDTFSTPQRRQRTQTALVAVAGDLDKANGRDTNTHTHTPQ